MYLLRSPIRPSVAAILLLAFTIPVAAQTSPAVPQQIGRAPSPSIGAQLFSGSMRFANGGPPCVSCHSAAGIPFPNGGTLGPDLTTASTRFGAQGLQLIVSTLFFPTMNPVFRGRLLTPAEQADLLAFLGQSSTNVVAPGLGWIFSAAGVVAAIALFIVTALLWRHRIRRVRQHLVAKTSGAPQP